MTCKKKKERKKRNKKRRKLKEEKEEEWRVKRRAERRSGCSEFIFSRGREKSTSLEPKGSDDILHTQRRILFYSFARSVVLSFVFFLLLDILKTVETQYKTTDEGEEESKQSVPRTQPKNAGGWKQQTEDEVG